MNVKRQMKLQFRRQPKKNATHASARPIPITILLSQYELLISLCKNLTSADIVHLAATSTEHWQYLATTPKLLQALIRDSSCDGTGIVAQARVFGYWDAKPEKATRKCRGRDARPCRDCGAMVCNVVLALVFLYYSTTANDEQMCRFHIQYPAYGPYAHDATGDPAEYLNKEEQEMWDEQWDSDEQDLSEEIMYGEVSVEDLGCYVETVKADDMFGSQMCMLQCVDCQPLIFKSHYFDPGPTCDCGYIYGHFCKEWRCIPCVLVEEAKLVDRRQKYARICRYMHNGEYQYIGVSDTMSLPRTTLTNAAGHLLRMRESHSRKRLGDLRVLWEDEWVVRWSQRGHDGTHPCAAWDSA